MPNEEYEAACRRFLFAILEVHAENRFLAELAACIDTLTAPGVVNSLTQTVLRMTSPGVPDLYQGTDFWDFSLVDPDNRQPVDYGKRMQALQSVAPLVDIDTWRDGRLKQQIILRTLQLRAREPELFLQGDYSPLELEGALAGHAIAFARRYGDRSVIVLTTHLPFRILAQDGTPVVPPVRWQDTALLCPWAQDSTWNELYSRSRVRISSGKLMLADALAQLPVAVLMEA